VSGVLVELSGESLELARAEVAASAEALGGHGVGPAAGSETLYEVDVPGPAVVLLAARLALARRCLLEVPGGPGGLPRPARPGATASFRPLRSPSGGAADAGVRLAAQAWKEAGGLIDLEAPAHRYWSIRRGPAGDTWLEEVAAVDRRATSARTISRLPFRRPIGLPPRLARAAANLTRAGPGSRVVDPFVGTGALLAEAAFLGASTVGIDRDPKMVQGALRNFAFLGVSAEAMVVGDSGDADVASAHRTFDALLTDLPYGRASGTGGEDAEEVARRAIPLWSEHVRAGGRLVVVAPGGADPVGSPWRRTLSVPVRVHRSLTREFRVYERAP
jgi:predicted RNA methylase